MVKPVYPPTTSLRGVLICPYKNPIYSMSKDDYFISLLQVISVQKLLEGPI